MSLRRRDNEESIYAFIFDQTDTQYEVLVANGGQFETFQVDKLTLVSSHGIYEMIPEEVP